MTRSDLNFTLFLLGLSGIYALLHLLSPGLVIATYVGDTIHAIDLAFRMHAGDAPGRDFSTPLGVLSILPASLLLDAGLGPGRAFLLGQVLVLATLAPAILWVSLSRLSGWPRYGFALYVAGLICALVYGGSDPTSSIFMYYNRWGWALTFLIAVQVMLPPSEARRRPLLDGVVLGAMMGLLVGIKVTFFLGLAPFVLLALLVDRKFGTLAAAAVSGLVTLALITAAAGYPGYLLDYANDLLLVAGSAIRPRPGLGLSEMIATPAMVPGTLLLFATIVLWRKSGAHREGLLGIVLGAGLVYVTYQNWGNDPKWALLFALLASVVAMRSDGTETPHRQAGLLLAAGLAVFAAPSALNILKSPLRPVTAGQARLAPLFPPEVGRDVLILSGMLDEPMGAMPIRAPGLSGTPANGAAADTPAPLPGEISFGGVAFPSCRLYQGAVTEMLLIVSDLAAMPELEGQEVILADFGQYLWLFGDFSRSKNGVQPWYYGGDIASVGAGYLAVPACPVKLNTRKAMLTAIEDSGQNARLVGQTSSVTVFRLE